MLSKPRAVVAVCVGLLLVAQLPSEGWAANTSGAAAPTIASAKVEFASANELKGNWTCAPQGRTCTFDSDCCSKNCVRDPKLGKVCKPKGASWTCVPQGRTCTFDSNCCSKNCVRDPKLGKVCKPKGASWTCVPLGRTCTFDSNCCSKNCVHDPKIGKVCKPPKR